MLRTLRRSCFVHAWLAGGLLACGSAAPPTLPATLSAATAGGSGASGAQAGGSGPTGGDAGSAVGGASGNAGASGGSSSAGSNGAAGGSGVSGDAGTSGDAGASAGTSGNAGAGGNTGNGGAGTSGNAGSGAAGTGGSAGAGAVSGSAGTSGSAGGGAVSGSAGATGGSSGAGGSAGGGYCASNMGITITPKPLPSNQDLTFEIDLFSSLPDPIALSRIKVRFYFTREETSPQLVQFVTCLVFGSPNCTAVGTIYPYTPVQKGADAYLEITSNSPDFLTSTNEYMFSLYVTADPALPNDDVGNDYSFLYDNAITVYIDDQLYLGCPPDAGIQG